MKRVSAYLISLVLGSSSLYAASLNNGLDSAQQQKPQMSGHQGMMQAMTSMCENMESMSMTGDSNVDFVKMMIPHHQSAVDMASAYLKTGDDTMLIDMANKIIEAQQKEIQQLQDWLLEHQKNRTSSLVN